MADRKHLLHVKSNVVEKTRQYGIDDFLVTPKKPVDLMYGEIAVNYGKGVEALTIKNSEDNVVAFVNENDFYEAGEITAAALATEKKEREEAEFVTADALNYLNDKIDTSAVSVMVSTTYDEIKSLRDQSKLKSGQFYRITDYVTTSTQKNTRSAGHAFDVIVIATDVDTLNENAKAIKHEGDTYFADCNLDAWEIKYDLDNNTNKYAWADETNGKGVIFYMKDEWDNECPYDFKNIQFKRWAVTDVQNDKLDETTLNSLKAAFVYNNDNTKFIPRYAYKNSDCVYGDTTHLVNGDDSDWYYTFSTFKFENNIFALNEIEDASIKGNNFYNDESGGGCLGNSIKPDYDNMASKYDGIDGVQYLNNIVFNGYYETIEKGYVYHCFANSIGYRSYNFTFGNGCHGNSFGNDCSDNSFGHDCSNNSFGNHCLNNSFGISYKYNSFGNGCGGNSFGNSCYNNTFGNDCSDNSFGNSCYYNSFGNNCDHNIFGDSCESNSFGDDCSSNSFENSCTNNSFENDCDNNTFGDNCSNNLFGNHCGGNSFVNNCDGNSFGNGCSCNTFGEYCRTNSFGGGCFNNLFGNNCGGGNTFGNNCIFNSFGNNCGGNTFGDNCGSNTFGNNCDGNSFGNGCGSNTFVNRCDYNSFGNNVAQVKFEKDYMYYNIIENGNAYITVTSTQTTSSGLKLRNFTIAQGVNNAASEEQRKTISHDTTNDTFRTIYQNASSQTVNV